MFFVVDGFSWSPCAAHFLHKHFFGRKWDAWISIEVSLQQQRTEKKMKVAPVGFTKVKSEEMKPTSELAKWLSFLFAFHHLFSHFFNCYCNLMKRSTEVKDSWGAVGVVDVIIFLNGACANMAEFTRNCHPVKSFCGSSWVASQNGFHWNRPIVYYTSEPI